MYTHLVTNIMCSCTVQICNTDKV